GQRHVVLLGVVAEQRQAQPALALEGAVARAAVAAGPAEQAHDVALEVHLFDGAAVGQRDGGVGREGWEQAGGEGEAGAEAGEAGSVHSAVLLAGALASRWGGRCRWAPPPGGGGWRVVQVWQAGVQRAASGGRRRPRPQRATTN